MRSRPIFSLFTTLDHLGCNIHYHLICMNERYNEQEKIMDKPITLIVVVFLLLIAVMHLLRLFFGVEVIIAGAIIPQWASLFGCIVPGGLAIMLKRESVG